MLKDIKFGTVLNSNHFQKNKSIQPHLSANNKELNTSKDDPDISLLDDDERGPF